MTVKGSKIEIIRQLAFMLAIVMLACNIGFAWFRNRVYEGGAMEYKKVLHVGSNSAGMVTYIGVNNEEGGLEYVPLYLTENGEAVLSNPDNSYSFTYDYSKCAELASLLPGERQYFYTEITNLTEPQPGEEVSDMYVSLFLEDVFNTPILDEYLYFAVTSPEVSMTNYYLSDTYSTGVTYTGGAEVGQDETFSRIATVPLARHMSIPSGQTVRVYWYLYLDTGAGNECIGSRIIFERLRLQFNS